MNPQTKNPFNQHATWGYVLIGIGALLLLNSFDILRHVGSLIASFVFLAGGAACLMVFLNDRRHWWAIFPAFGLGFIGAMIGLDAFFPRLDIGGPLFLGGLGFSFLAAYMVRREQVWPVVPGGIFLTLAAVSAFHDLFPALGEGWLFFFGLALTFAAVYQLSGARQQDSWALIVAAICGGIGLLAIGGMILQTVFPLLLIIGGAWMLFRNTRQQ